MESGLELKSSCGSSTTMLTLIANTVIQNWQNNLYCILQELVNDPKVISFSINVSECLLCAGQKPNIEDKVTEKKDAKSSLVGALVLGLSTLRTSTATYTTVTATTTWSFLCLRQDFKWFCFICFIEALNIIIFMLQMRKLRHRNIR